MNKIYKELVDKMTKVVKIPWSAWYTDEDYPLEFPDSWDVSVFKMTDAPEITNITEMERTLNNPIGTLTLEEIAKGKRTAAIVIDDISRPTKANQLVKVVLKQLYRAGITNDKITIIFAIGAHRPMNRSDFIKKVGLDIVETIKIENHHPYENLVYIGESSKGTPIYINKTYYESEVKIAISSVITHPLAGFGGGAKIILPGICGIQTLEANHLAASRGIGIGLGFITDLRKDIEDVTSKVGLDFSINTISTLKRGIAGIFAGDYLQAHRKAVEFGQKVYATKVSTNPNLDVCFFNLYPEDTELSQSQKGFNVYFSAGKIIQRKGTMVISTAATEGRGFHSLLGETGSKLYNNMKDLWEMTIKNVLGKIKFALYSPNVSAGDVFHFYPKSTIFHNNFKKLLSELETYYGDAPKVGIFPSSTQMPMK